MRRLLLILLLLALTATAADARRRHHRSHWRAVVVVVPQAMAPQSATPQDFVQPFAGSRAERKARADAAALIPPDWQLQPPDPAWQGRRYVSPSGAAWLAIYSRAADSEPLAQHLKSIAFVEGEDITFLQRERDWLVVSGFKADRIFYRKVVLGCDGRMWRHIAFEYPADAKRAFDSLVTRVSRGLTSAAGEECSAVANRD